MQYLQYVYNKLILDIYYIGNISRLYCYIIKVMFQTNKTE